MRIFKYLMLFIAFGVMLGSCSKDDELELKTTGVASFSIKIEFDEESLNPEWLANLSGYYLHENKDVTIKGYEFWKELDTEVGVGNFWGTSFFSDDQPIQPSVHIEFDQKATGLHFTLKVKGEDGESVTPTGSVLLFKNEKLFKEFPISSQETKFVYTVPYTE